MARYGAQKAEMCETAEKVDKPDCYRIYRIWEHQASDGLLIIALASDRRAGRRRRESAGRRDLLPGGPE